MKKLVFVLLSMILCIGCSYNKCNKVPVIKDSLVKIFDSGGIFTIPLDSFLQVKDSFVFCKEEGLWMTKKLYWFNYECPDTIIVAFTRNGVFKDSVEAIRRGDIEDSTGNSYSPAYVVLSVVGDAWVYDINGKFIAFHEGRFPHSGKPHSYKP